MKRGIVILFLLLFSLRPAYYMGQLMYYELNLDYIIETYCVNKDKPEMRCNGKCHLAKQLQLPQTSGKDMAVSILYEAFFPVFMQALPSYEVPSGLIETSPKALFSYHKLYAFDVAYTLYRPPIG